MKYTVTKQSSLPKKATKSSLYQRNKHHEKPSGGIKVQLFQVNFHLTVKIYTALLKRFSFCAFCLGGAS